METPRTILIEDTAIHTKAGCGWFEVDDCSGGGGGLD